MPILLLLLALGLAANVVLGPLGLGLIAWRVSANLINQTYGADAATLALVVPAALAAAWLWWRGRRLAAPLALGAGLAALYYAVAEVLGPDYTRYAGNNERFFPLFLAVIVLAWVVAARAWVALDPEPPRPAPWLARAFAAVLLAAGALLAVAWLAQVLDIARTGGLGQAAQAREYAEAPTAFWVVRIVDLGVIAPACLATGVGLWRGRAAAIKAAYGLAAFLTLQGASVLAMGAVMLWRRDPTASPALVYALAPVVLAAAAGTLALMRSYAGRAPAAARRRATAAAHA
ncbi:MAG TPA: hypothetical protein VFL91_01315 [Thermomicrobiales bacterium]|nr:hypothetical protein [Thermomicrobiales bacterium]